MAGEEAWGFVLAIVLLILFAVAVGVFLLVFWIMMIVDAAKRKFDSDGTKVVWILVLIFLQILGAAIYYFAVKRVSVPASSLRKKKRTRK